MPVFTISFSALLIIIYTLDTFLLIPKNETVPVIKKLIFGHNKGYINRALHLSDEKIKKGEVWRLVSSSLLHVGFFHIALNVTALLIAGYAVESELGSIKALICYFSSTLLSGLFMSFVYKLHEGEGASPGIFGLIAVFVILAIKNGTIMFSGLPPVALIVLALYTVTGIITEKATFFEHLSGFAGGLLSGLALIYLA